MRRPIVRYKVKSDSVENQRFIRKAFEELRQTPSLWVEVSIF